MKTTANPYIFETTRDGYYVRINNAVINLHRYFVDYISAASFVYAITK